ncbi:MAG: hypothetical protein PWP76_678 [Candidatus Diapherotrites archaeon]|nr:hypothetical protein [Candidatus Diapherotrites archaeon]
MDVDAVVTGILITFFGVLLLLERLGVISFAALYTTLPFVFIVVGLLTVYVGIAKDRLAGKKK